MGFSATSPELDVKEKVALMELEGINVRLLIEPTDYATDGKIEVKSELDAKSPSQRLRGCLYVLFRQQESKLNGKTWPQFYLETMDRITNDVKSQLEPE